MDVQTLTRRVCRGGFRLGPQWNQCLCKGVIMVRDGGKVPEVNAWLWVHWALRMTAEQSPECRHVRDTRYDFNVRGGLGLVAFVSLGILMRTIYVRWLW